MAAFLCAAGRVGGVCDSKMVGERQSMETFVEVCVVCVGSISSLSE